MVAGARFTEAASLRPIYCRGRAPYSVIRACRRVIY